MLDMRKTQQGKSVVESEHPVGDGVNRTMCFLEVAFDDVAKFSNVVFDDDVELHSFFADENSGTDFCLYVNVREGLGRFPCARDLTS